MTQKLFAMTSSRMAMDHVVSGAIAGMIGGGGIGYYNYKNGNHSKQEVVKETVKLASQGAIISGCAIASSNYIAQNNYIEALGVIAIGFGAVVGIEKLASTKKEENK